MSPAAPTPASEPEVGLSLRLVSERCTRSERSLSGALFAALQGGSTGGACGCRLARIVLTPAAARLALAGGLPADVTLCVNPACATGLADMRRLQGLLGLLRR